MRQDQRKVVVQNKVRKSHTRQIFVLFCFEGYKLQLSWLCTDVIINWHETIIIITIGSTCVTFNCIINCLLLYNEMVLINFTRLMNGWTNIVQLVWFTGLNISKDCRFQINYISKLKFESTCRSVSQLSAFIKR